MRGRQFWSLLLIVTVRALQGAPHPERCELLSQLHEEYGDTTTLVTALFRGDSEGLLAILSAAASDPGPCLVDVVLPCNAPAELAEIAHAEVDKAAYALLSTGTLPAGTAGKLNERVFRVVEGDAEDDICTGARSEWERRFGGAKCQWTGYHIIMEDGIEYPDDYLVVARQAVDSMSRRAIIGYSGFVWNVAFIKMGVPYAETTYALPLSGLEGSVDIDVWVDVLRLGTVAFHSDLSVHAHTHLDQPSREAGDAAALHAKSLQTATGKWSLDAIRFTRGIRSLWLTQKHTHLGTEIGRRSQAACVGGTVGGVGYYGCSVAFCCPV